MQLSPSAPVDRWVLHQGIRLAPLGLAAAALLSGMLSVSAGPGVPRVVEVPSRPAFIKAPRSPEIPARTGQLLAVNTLLRTQKPGRLQVLLTNGRSFRLGGDAVLRLSSNGLDLEKGQIIAWVNPGRKGGSPLKIRTRVATASIVGTTVFIEATPEVVKVFSWEGKVQVVTDSGQQFHLSSGQQLAFEKDAWVPPRRLTPQEAAIRRQKSILLNGFEAPMETLPVIEKELGLKTVPEAAVAVPPAPVLPR